MKRFIAMLGMFLSAVLTAVAIFEPKAALLAWVALIPLLFSCKVLSGRRNFFYSWLAGIIFFGLILYWLNLPVYDYGGSLRFLGIGAIVLLYGILGLFWGLFGWLAGKVLQGKKMCPILSIPALWTGLELLRRLIIFSLPIGFLGISQAPFPYLIQSADIFGTLGISFLIALINTALYLMFTDRLVVRRFGIIMAVLLLFLIPYTLWCMRVPQESLLKVGLVQSNIFQEDKWAHSLRNQIADTHIALSQRLLAEDGPVDLLVWPESAVSIEPLLEKPAWRNFMGRVDILQTPILLGILNTVDGNIYNSSFLIIKKEVVERYDKMWLVPFGEYVPFPNLLGWVNTGFMPNTPGKELQFFDYGNQRWATPICYEILNPTLMRRMSKEATMIFNLSNEAWFKKSHGLPLLWSTTILRAVEMRRPIVKAANTGYSGYINDQGRVEVLFPANEPAVQALEVMGGNKNSLYVRFGDWPLIILLITCFIVAGSIGSGNRRWGEQY